MLAITLVQRSPRFIEDFFVFPPPFYIYNPNMSNSYFVTGISGSGKSTLAKELKNMLPSENFVVHDFDEVGVPKNPKKSWRIETTNYWVDKAGEHKKNNMNMVLCGQFMPSEVKNSPSFSKSLYIKWGFLKIDNNTIENRLTTYRKLSKEKIDTFKIWAIAIENEVRNEEDFRIFEVSKLSPKKVTSLILGWVKKE